MALHHTSIVNKSERRRAVPVLPMAHEYRQMHIFSKKEKFVRVACFSNAFEIEFYRDADFEQKVDWNDADIVSFGRGGKCNIFEICDKLHSLGYKFVSSSEYNESSEPPSNRGMPCLF